MACGRCGLRWGVSDVDRPQCLELERRQRPRGPAGTAMAQLRAEYARGPVLPEGGFVTPERRQDPEQRAMFEALARAVDLRELLVKYMRHMRREEGSTGAAWIGSDGRGYFSDVLFSPSEVALLKLCADEAEDGGA
jgi:hypothetical protein